MAKDRFQQIENGIEKKNKKTKICFRNIEIIPGNTWEKRMRNFFRLNLEVDTIFQEKVTVQTLRYRRRSIGDIYWIMLYYYPEAHLKDVFKAIHKLIKDGEIGTFFCNDIRKRVYRHDITGFIPVQTDLLDEYGLFFQDWEDWINDSIEEYWMSLVGAEVSFFGGKKGVIMSYSRSWFVVKTIDMGKWPVIKKNFALLKK